MNTRTQQYLVATALALGLMACASTPKTISSIEDARAAIQAVERDPLAGEAAAKEIDGAHEALREAEARAEDHKPAKDIDNAAYMAKRQAQIAQEKIAALQAKKAQESAAAERQAIVLDAREQEARIAAESAKQKMAEADRKAKELEGQDAANKERIARLQQELADLNAKKTERGFVLTLGDVLFDTGQATLKPGAVPVIDRLAKFLIQTPERSVQIEGHTDSVGTDAYNQDLSMRRASAVRDALQGRGVPADRVIATGKGEALPIASNDSAGGRQQNRRVEIIIEDPARGASL
jgi:OmpA-OmpF porin, OOP family